MGRGVVRSVPLGRQGDEGLGGRGQPVLARAAGTARRRRGASVGRDTLLELGRFEPAPSGGRTRHAGNPRSARTGGPGLRHASPPCGDSDAGDGVGAALGHDLAGYFTVTVAVMAGCCVHRYGYVPAVANVRAYPPLDSVTDLGPSSKVTL